MFERGHTSRWNAIPDSRISQLYLSIQISSGDARVCVPVRVPTATWVSWVMAERRTRRSWHMGPGHTVPHAHGGGPGPPQCRYRESGGSGSGRGDPASGRNVVTAFPWELVRRREECRSKALDEPGRTRSEVRCSFSKFKRRSRGFQPQSQRREPKSFPRGEAHGSACGHCRPEKAAIGRPWASPTGLTSPRAASSPPRPAQSTGLPRVMRPASNDCCLFPCPERSLTECAYACVLRRESLRP